MTPEMYRIIVPTDAPVLLVQSDNYRRRVSIMYRRTLATVDGAQVDTYLFINHKNLVDPFVGGRGIFILPAMQAQFELDKKDYIWGQADPNTAGLTPPGLEVSIIVESLQDDNPVETTRPGGGGGQS